MCNLTSKLRRVYFNILPKNSLVVSVCDFGGGRTLYWYAFCGGIPC